jgi:non-ribosomal peptide synthetase-like protein
LRFAYFYRTRTDVFLLKLKLLSSGIRLASGGGYLPSSTPGASMTNLTKRISGETPNHDAHEESPALAQPRPQLYEVFERSERRHGAVIADALRERSERNARHRHELETEIATRGTLHAVFEEVADTDPLAPALECAGQVWSYALLDAEANRLARYLRSLGVGPGCFVGISMSRSEWPIIAILGILKAGGAYVPVEPSLPDARLAYIAEAADFSVLLTDDANADRIKKLFAGQVATIEGFQARAQEFSSARLADSELRVEPTSVCYVLFTSGTTGHPKGVVTEHRNAVHFVRAFNSVCTTTSSDRVFQGFSLGFDGSVEEMWMAFSNGATLVCGDHTTPRFGADLCQTLDNLRITFFSTVPTLLSTLPHDLPSLRQLVVSGEACHPDLVERWARPGRTMLNVYGPTEATVNTTAAVLLPGKPVTIGRPLPGYEAYILDEDHQPVECGQKGQLFIASPGLCRGYLNQPELTECAFLAWRAPDQPASAPELRLYRTGDLVSENAEGELEFFGRIDGQVKLRGFRVELSEIEAVLVELEEISAAAVAVKDLDGLDTLAAYVLLVDGAERVDRSKALAKLRDRLPVYMIPAFLDVVNELPRLASGKVDRRSLPPPRMRLASEVQDSDSVLSPLEAEIASIWASQMQIPSVGANQDFFKELGGHSLLAAQVTTSLHKQLGRQVSVRDLYAHPTVKALAAELERRPVLHSASALPVADEPRAQPKPGRYWISVVVQSLYYLAIIPILALPAAYIIPVAVNAVRTGGSLPQLASLSLALVLGTWAALILIAIAAKWVLIGHYRAGRYPLWGGFYIRWWLASRLQHLSNLAAFNGTPLAPLLWRAMGARVGRRCLINASLVYAWDCVKIGNDVSIGFDTHMPALRIEGGDLVIGEIEIGDGCFIGNHSTLGLDAKMHAGAMLDDQSLLPDGFVAQAGIALRGSPPVAASVVVPEGEPVRPSPVRLAVFSIVQLVLGVATTLAVLAPVWLSTAVIAWLFVHYPLSISIPAFLAAVPATMFVFAIWSALMKKLVHPNPRPGLYRVYSRHYLQHWLADLVIQLIKAIGLPIFTTLYLPAWMRLLGARLGRNTEMSTVWRINPDMVTAGDGVFFADGCMIGEGKAHLGWFEVARNEIGDRSFIGNSAILSLGDSIGSDCLLGVLSATPNAGAQTPDGSDWLGSPSFRLPNRQRVTCFSKQQTFMPTRTLYLQRAMIDGLRVVLPGYILGTFGIISLLVVVWAQETYGMWGAYTAIPLLTWLGLMMCIGSVVGAKWLIMGRFKPEVVPLWSSYVWWNELVNGLYECLMAPWVSNFFGTPFAPALLRTLGCKIGKQCYLETNLFSEFDLVEIGDRVVLNAGTVVQNHLFEDRIMKSSRLKLCDGVTVGNLSVILYDTIVEREAVLDPMSLLMKGETMPAGARWRGIPTVAVER